jgi:DNA-binding transcriptional LysR family regulator
VLALVAAGQGVAVVPHLGIVDPTPAVTLTRLPIHRRTKIAYRTGAAGHPAVAATAVALRGSVPGELTCTQGMPLPRSIQGTSGSAGLPTPIP